ncbi:MAG: hypothetical protein AB7V39_00375, partial [Nitrospiraceae bacterium]
KIYLARKMTGLTAKELVEESVQAARTAEELYPGVKLLDPVKADNHKAMDSVVAAKEEMLRGFWRRDKEMIRVAHVLIDMTGPAKSEGVAHEIGYARYCLWKPVIRIWPGLPASVARIEDDIIVEHFVAALDVAEQLWGTRTKRIIWRLKMLNRCLPKWIMQQLGEFK